MGIISVVKENPGKTALAVGAVILFVFFATRGGGGSAATYASDSGDVEAATAIQAAQLQAQTQTAAINAQVQAQISHDASQLELAKIQGAYATNANELGASVALAQINAQQQLGSLQSSLEAATEQARIKSSTDQLSIATSGQTQQQQLLVSALVDMSRIQSNTAIAGINAQKDVATQSWFDKIFG